MGYQESLIYIQPQEQVGQIVKEYLMARQQDPSGRFLADILAAVRLQAPLKGCPAGSVLLWAAGERSNNMLQAAMPDDWRLPGFCTVRTIPVEDIQHLLDHAVRDGIENELLGPVFCRICVDAGAAKNEQGKRRRRAGAVIRFGLFRWNIK